MSLAAETRCVRCFAEGTQSTQPCPNCVGYSKDARRLKGAI